MQHESAINSLQQKRMELIAKREQYLSEINAEISDLENSIETLSGKKVWETSPQDLYDDDNHNYLKPSYEE